MYNEKDKEECRLCKSKNITNVEIPYCFKLLQQELLQCGIMVK